MDLCRQKLRSITNVYKENTDQATRKLTNPTQIALS